MPSIPILFGTETGNAEYSAKELKSAIDKAGFAASVVDMANFTPEALALAPLVFIITSTYGKGDPPVNAEKLLKHLEQDAPELSALRYGVCALGDSTYQDFAQCGRDFDRRLADNGARRVVDLCVCDAEFEEFFPTFKENVLAWLATTGDEFRGPAEAPAQKKGFFKKLFGVFGGGSDAPSAVSPIVAPAARDEHAPTSALVLRRRRLNAEGSAKETMHYELSLEGTGIHYEPGDCIAIHPQNAPHAVAAFLRAFSLNGDAPVLLDERELTLSEALATRDFQRITSGLAEILRQGKGPLAEPGADAKDYRHRRHLSEAVAEHTHLPDVAAQTLLGALLPTPARLYSIASSQRVTPNEVHLTIETPRYSQDGFTRVGLASGYLADRVRDGEKVTIHKVAGAHFRVAPANVDMILIGPGTGVAPYRAFLLERQALGATGKNWLFFGHQHEGSDFLYRSEFESMQASGLLTRLDCAWSRDQDQKRYVQHLMEEASAELWSWLERGALLYVCGDKLHMAAGVHRSLVSIVSRHGSMTTERAEAWVKDLETRERYRLDIY